jgi:Glyoxalase superfamily protein
VSRTLPFRPSLEHLKKQAKVLLRELQATRPDAQLADAQHQLAREYGFASWPALHAHVDALPREAPEHPLAGTWNWRADPSIEQTEPYRQITLHVNVNADVVTIRDVVIDASGQELRNESVLRVDGNEHAQPHGYGISARWVGTHALEAVGTKDGRVEGRVTYQVSSDGGTLTLHANERRLQLTRM